MTKSLRKKSNIWVIMLFLSSLWAHQLLHNSTVPKPSPSVGVTVAAERTWQNSRAPLSPQFFPAELCLICAGFLIADDLNTEISLPYAITSASDFTVYLSPAAPSSWLKTSPRAPPTTR